MNIEAVNYFMLFLIGSPILLVLCILTIRFSNKYKKSGEDEEQRKNPKLRRLLNVMMATLVIAAIIAMIILVVYIYAISRLPGGYTR